MGLSLEVGMLADLKTGDPEGHADLLEQLDAVNTCLERHGLPPHREPDDCVVWSADMLGYAGLHFLRRLAAHLDLTGRLPPPGGEDSAADPMLQRYTRAATGTESRLARLMRRGPTVRHFDHLILHSDAEGYYLPADFAEVLFAEPSFGIAGELIGSVPRLRDECRRLAEALDVPGGLSPDDDELWLAADRQGEGGGAGKSRWQRYGVETLSCVTLAHACEASLRTGAAIVFC